MIAVAAVAGLALAACGTTSPHAASSTTRPSNAGHPSRPSTTLGTHATPASVLPLLDKAISDENRGQYALAAAEFLTVVKKDPGSQIAWYDLGVIAVRDGQTSQAIRDYKTAIIADRDYVPALYNLANIYEPNQPKAAVTLYQDVLRLQPSDATAHLNLGFALKSLGRITPARAQFAEAIRLSPPLASRVLVADGGTA